MPRYKLTVAYDGTDYFGWQKQKERASIERALFNAFTGVFRVDCSLLGASRTDAGVHALGQVVRCETPIVLKPETLRHVWNRALPQSIVIRSLELVDDDFNPHAHVHNKTYYYHFFIRRPLPFLARYGWYVQRPINLDRLNQALALFQGTHDFRSFCAQGFHPKGTIRTIDTISVSYLRRFDAYQISVTGKCFMRHMIRRIVGAALHSSYEDGVPLSEVQRVLLAKNPSHCLPTAPAQGLLLHSIRYEKT